jgi:hypothetical protein
MLFAPVADGPVTRLSDVDSETRVARGDAEVEAGLAAGVAIAVGFASRIHEGKHKSATDPMIAFVTRGIADASREQSEPVKISQSFE